MMELNVQSLNLWLKKERRLNLKRIIFMLVSVIGLLCFMLVLYAREIYYLESKVAYFDELAEGYREIVHENYECPPFPWYTLYDKTGKRPPHLFPDFAMNKMDGEFKDIRKE